MRKNYKSKMKTEIMWTALFVLLAVTNIVPSVRHFSAGETGEGIFNLVLAVVMAVFAVISAGFAVRYHRLDQEES